MKRFKIFEIFFISIVLINIVPVFAEENDTDTATSFHQAILRGQIVKIRSLLESGVDINIRDKQERTPLHTAIDQKKNQIVKLLLEKNADVNLIDNMGDTPMHLAVKTGQLKVVELLIEKGADVNAVDAQSNSPLSMAQKAGQKQIADLLIKHGAKETKLDEEASFDRNRITGREQSLENMESQFQRQPDTTQEEEEPEIDILADPNEIRARIKTYEGLEKSIEEVASKSRIGIRHWQKITEDNRVALVRVVKKQIDGEVEFIHKVSLEEKAKKTAEAAETLMTKKKERTAKVLKELTAQSREQNQNRTEERTRSRSSGRSSRGTGSQSGRGSGRSRGTQPPNDQGDIAPRNEGEEQEQLDDQTQYEIDLWLGADTQNYDNKLELADSVHEQTFAEYYDIRKIAEQENAKKTIATIDGLLLERQQRLDELAKYMEEEKQKQEEQQDQPGQTRTTQENTNRRGGRSGTRDRSSGTRSGRR